MSQSHTDTLSAHAALAARLARVPLYRHRLTAAGRDWLVDAVKDQDLLLAAADHFDAFPYGLLLWDSAVVLADALASLGRLDGKRLLELGSGVGIAGLAARHLGAEVVQTDHAAEALELARRNAALNGIEGIAQRLADWARWDGTECFDLVIGSDVLYDGSAHAPIAKVLEASLTDGGTVLLADPGRTATPFFIRDMTAAGWRVEQRVRAIDAVHPVWAEEQLNVTVLMISRTE